LKPIFSFSTPVESEIFAAFGNMRVEARHWFLSLNFLLPGRPEVRNLPIFAFRNGFFSARRPAQQG
jgi:hypothetical protein